MAQINDKVEGNLPNLHQLKLKESFKQHVTYQLKSIFTMEVFLIGVQKIAYIEIYISSYIRV
jgi:hypothetical protein